MESDISQYQDLTSGNYKNYSLPYIKCGYLYVK